MSKTADPRRLMTEKDVTEEIITALKNAKYVTPKEALGKAFAGQRAGFVLKCSKVPPMRGARGAGGDNGLPDFFVYSMRLRKWLAFEAKRPLISQTKIYPEQQLLAAFEATHIVTSAQEVLAILAA